MAVESQPSPVGAQPRKQLSNAMEHLRGFVTLETQTTSPTATPISEEEDSYGVPSSIEPIRKPRTSAVENTEKRTDPFQFGSRYLEEGDDIFSFNAWDHVETDDAYKTFAEECYQNQKQAPVSEFDRSTHSCGTLRTMAGFYGTMLTGVAERYNEHPERQWNKFYSNNANNFFKNRKWLHQEFPILNEVTKEDSSPTVLLEVGAGAGNTAFPVLKLNKNPQLKIYACDFSRTAVEVIQNHEEYKNSGNIGSIEASVWDAAETGPTEDEPYSLPTNVLPATVDIIIMVFIFSALAPSQWVQAVRNAWHALKPGGVLLFRDYGRGDLAQVRFKKGRWMDDNFYVRGDGTRVYFFEEEELRRIWGQEGGFEVASFGVDRRMLVNRQRRLKMYRCWMQAVFRKPDDARKEVDAVEALTEEVGAAKLA